MAPGPTSPWRAFGQLLLIGGLLAGALTGCGVRQRRQSAETATAAAGAATNTGPAAEAATATPDTAQSDVLDGQLEALSTELSSADTLDDLETALPPDEPAATPGAEAAATTTPAPEATTASGGEDEQGAEIEQMLDTLQNSLDQTDTVDDAANP